MSSGMKKMWLVGALATTCLAIALVAPIPAGGQVSVPQSQPTTTMPAASPAEKSAMEKYQAMVFRDAQGNELKYRLLIPAGYDKTKATKYPMVMFMHGSGERGEDNVSQLKNGVAAFFASDEAMKDAPCFAVVPQCPSNAAWSNRGGRGGNRVAQLELVFGLIAQMQKDYKIDADRIAIGGLSLGGMGTWAALCEHPEMFSAAVPICGNGDTTKIAGAAKVAIWAWHGAKDTTVPTEGSQKMIAALKAAGGTPKYNEVPDVGHNVWDNAFREPGLLKWVVEQKRGAAQSATNATTKPATETTVK